MKKWILTQSGLIFGENVKQHNDLFKRAEHQKCMGGGWWHVNEFDKTITLYSSSILFGKATYNMMESHGNKNNLPEQYDDYRIFFSRSESLETAMHHCKYKTELFNLKSMKLNAS